MSLVQGQVDQGFCVLPPTSILWLGGTEPRIQANQLRMKVTGAASRRTRGWTEQTPVRRQLPRVPSPHTQHIGSADGKLGLISSSRDVKEAGTPGPPRSRASAQGRARQTPRWEIWF